MQFVVVVEFVSTSVNLQGQQSSISPRGSHALLSSIDLWSFTPNIEGMAPGMILIGTAVDVHVWS